MYKKLLMTTQINTLRISLFLTVLFLISSCASVFYSPDAFELAGNHRTIAILPPSISIAANKKIDAESLKEQQRTESVNFQKEMYAWFLKRKMQGKIQQEIQELETTNAKLAKAGYPETPFTNAEICEILGVDGIMTSNFALSKPMSEGGAVALALLTGYGGSTNEIHASLSISDCSKSKLIWNYDYKISGGIGSSPSRIVDDFMRIATKKMPYMLN
jgi:hypothetical protein